MLRRGSPSIPDLLLSVPLKYIHHDSDKDIAREFRKNLPSEYFFVKGVLDNGNHPRLLQARDYFFSKPLDFEELKDCFNYWCNYPEYMVLKGSRIDIRSSKQDTKYVGFKCSKRGNDVYNRRIKKKLDIINSVDDIEFFKYTDKNPKTRGVFITLTFNPKLCSVKDAWSDVGSSWNRYLSGLKRKFGKFQVVRSWESYKNGYPHIHALVMFENQEFNVFLDDGKVPKFRIKNKSDFENWHSFVDVQAVRTYQGALKYITKEIFKVHLFNDTEDKKYNLTLALMWLFSKRGFSISKRFVDLIRVLHNSNKKRESKQINLEGIEIMDGWKWEFIGIYPSSALNLKGDEVLSVLPLDLGSKLPRKPKKNMNKLD